jgi:quercetin dioxygenase-like cupin family protein
MSPTAHLVDPNTAETIEVLGPTIQFLSTPEEDENAPCVMRGTIPPGGVVPLHTHADPETFLLVAGGVEGLSHSADGYAWVRIGPGDVFHVPGGARHAFRNRSQQPAVNLILTTERIGRFFREIAGPPSDEAIQRFLATAERYGYWNATPEENAELGLTPAGIQPA